MSTIQLPDDAVNIAPPAPITADPSDGSIVELTPSESHTLKEAFENAVINDTRCVGLSRYIANVRICWSYAIKTACAGHGFIFFNPAFYDSLPEETRLTVMVHEVWHLILKHLERGKDCDPRIHNRAADHVINLGLENDGFTFDGSDPCKDPQYRGMSTEQVYNKIFEAEKKNPSSKLLSDDNGEFVPAELIEDLVEAMVNPEGKTLEDQKDKAEKDIDTFTKGCGTQIGTLIRVLQLDARMQMIVGATYQEVFKPYLIDPLSGGKRTFMRPNRRQHGMNSKLQLPGRYPKRGRENRLTHLVYALDVSGSITSTQAQQFHTSVDTIKKLLNPSMLTVLFFDTRIVLEKTFTENQPYTNIKVCAGGGTDLREVYARTSQINPEALVIFTDLCVNIPPKPTWECIWFVPETRYSVPSNIYGEVYLIPEKK